MVRIVPLVVGIAAGLLSTSALYFDGFWDFQLMVMLGLTWTVAGWLMARNWRTMRKAQGRWQVLLVVLLFGVAMFGVHADLPISGNLWDALRLLILGGIWGSAALGIEIAHSHEEQRQSQIVTSAD